MTERLGKYELLGIIGRGGMGTVYRAFDPLLSRHVALKVVSLEDELSDEQKVRLLREGKACAQLTHPNIITVYGLGEDHGRFFMVMELLQGEDPKRVIAAHASLSLPEKLLPKLGGQSSPRSNLSRSHRIEPRDTAIFATTGPAAPEGRSRDRPCGCPWLSAEGQSVEQGQ